MLDGRCFPFNGRVVHAAAWDGHTKYRVAETKDEESERLQNWDKFLQGEQEEHKEHEDGQHKKPS